MPRSTRPLRYTYQNELDPNFVRQKYYYQNFKTGVQPIHYTTTASGTAVNLVAAAGVLAANATAQVAIPGCPFNWDIFGHTAQTNVLINTAGSGLRISTDEVDNEGIEIVPGQNSTSNPISFLTGTDSDFFFKAKFKITDADGADEFGIGFRKQETFSQTFSPSTGDPVYTDYLMFGFAGTVANPNAVRTSSDVADSGTSTRTSVNFTWADTLVHTLEIRVKSRVASLLINDCPLGGTVTKDGDGATITTQNTTSGPLYTFGNALTLVPFIFLQHDTAVSEALFLQEIEIGHLVDVGLDPNQR